MIDLTVVWRSLGVWHKMWHNWRFFPRPSSCGVQFLTKVVAQWVNLPHFGPGLPKFLEISEFGAHFGFSKKFLVLCTGFGVPGLGFAGRKQPQSRFLAVVASWCSWSSEVLVGGWQNIVNIIAGCHEHLRNGVCVSSRHGALSPSILAQTCPSGRRDPRRRDRWPETLIFSLLTVSFHCHVLLKNIQKAQGR